MTIQFNPNQVKTLSSTHQAHKALQTSHKSLAGAGQDPGLAQWVEQNRYIYDAIVSGNSDLSQADEAQFMEWWNYAMSEMNMGSSSWGEDFGMDVVDEDGDMGDVASVDPFGAQEGPMGNLVFTEDARIGFIGEERPYDIWGDLILDVSSNAATVDVRQTSDSRFTPPEAGVAVITVTDKASGKKSIYYVHNYVAGETKIQINTPKGKNVTDAGNLATVGEYKKPSEADPNAAPESSLPAEEIDGKLVVEAPIGQTIELTPTANGEDQTWEVYGAYNMNLRPSDKVTVIRTGTDPDIFEIVVTHRNGDLDTYLTQPGSKGNINATPENVTFIDRTSTTGTKNVHGVDVVDLNDLTVSDGTETSAPAPEVKVPEGWENLTLNGEGEGVTSEEQQGDAPTRMDGETRVYDGQDFNLYPVPEGEKKVTMVDAAGNVTINPNSNGEYFSLSYVDGRFVLEVYTDAARTQLKETIKIDANLVDSLTLNIDPSRLEMGDIPAEYKSIVKTAMGENVADGKVLPSREDILANMPQYLINRPEVQELVSLFDKAARSGSAEDWKRVKDKIASIGEYYVNDVLRSLVTSFSNIVGGDYVKLQEMLKLIPADVREEMWSSLERGNDSGWGNGDDESGEIHDGEIWNTKQTQQIIDASLD